jgi:hypothetical protein
MRRKEHPSMVALVFVILSLLPVTALADPVYESSGLNAQSARTEPLTISEVLARIELTHPLLRATGVERTQARAKILKALGAWEPTFKNRTEADRYQTWNFLAFVNETTGGFNDSYLEASGSMAVSETALGIAPTKVPMRTSLMMDSSSGTTSKFSSVGRPICCVAS